MTTQTVEAIGALDDKTFLPMVSVINTLPDSDLKELSYPEIREALDSRDMLYGVKHAFGTIVALAGAVIEQDGKTVRLKEIAATSRAEESATRQLMDEFIAGARGHGADNVVLDVTPAPGTAAGDFVERYGLAPNEHGAYILALADVKLG